MCSHMRATISTFLLLLFKERKYNFSECECECELHSSETGCILWLLFLSVLSFVLRSLLLGPFNLSTLRTNNTGDYTENLSNIIFRHSQSNSTLLAVFEFHVEVAEVTYLVGCHTVSLRKNFLTFRKTVCILELINNTATKAVKSFETSGTIRPMKQL